MSLLSKLFGKRDSLLELPAFAERYAAAVRDAWPDVRVTIVPAGTANETRVEWTLPGGFAVSHFLGNSYGRYRQAPDQLDAILAEHLASARSVQQGAANADADGALPAILPVLKTRGWHEASMQQLHAAGVPAAHTPFIVEPLAGDLVLTYVVDTPDSMSFLSPADAEQYDLDAAALRTCALANLSGFLPKLDVRGRAGRHAIRLDGNYDASMVLLFDRWRERAPVQGQPVFAIAARNELLVCGSDDPQGVASLREMAAKIVATSAYNLSQALYVYRDGKLDNFTD